MTTPIEPIEPTDPAATTTMTARSPEDLLALAPVILGFWPADSLVMMTFGTPRPFHARVDLPRRASPSALRALESSLLDPARAHEVGAVIFLAYAESERGARAACRVLRRGAARAGIEVIACIWADGTRYRVIGGLMGGGPFEAIPYDVSNHPFVVRAVVQGRLTFASRAEMVASLAPREGACADTEAALRELGLGGSGPATVEGEAVAWVERTVSRHVAAGDVPDLSGMARLVWSVQAVPARDAAWALIDRANAAAHRIFWAAILPRTPERLVPAVADLLAFASWQSGDGAFAWAALDRAQAVHPQDRMAGLLAGMLENAVPPDAWPSGRSA